jgi:hypothetical protein
MNKSCFYYPKVKDLALNKRNFILGRIEKYEQIKKRIGKVYSIKGKITLSRTLNHIQTSGKVIQLEEKKKAKMKDKRTSMDSNFSEPFEFKISTIIYPRNYK